MSPFSDSDGPELLTLITEMRDGLDDIRSKIQPLVDMVGSCIRVEDNTETCDSLFLNTLNTVSLLNLCNLSNITGCFHIKLQASCEHE